MEQELDGQVDYEELRVGSTTLASCEDLGSLESLTEVRDLCFACCNGVPSSPGIFSCDSSSIRDNVGLSVCLSFCRSVYNEFSWTNEMMGPT